MKTFRFSVTNRFFAAAAAAIVAFVGATSSATAQSVDFGLGLSMGVPMGDFGDTLDSPGFGIEGHLGYQLPHSPLMFGLQGGVMTYGNEGRDEPWSHTIPDVTVRVETSHNIANGHLFVRLMPETGMIRPYVDGLFGFNYLFTSTSVENKGASSENSTIASSTNYSDGALSYGGAAGVQIRFYEKPAVVDGGFSDDEEEADLREALVDLRVGYLSGGEASYLTNGSVRRTDSKVTYDAKTSRTDLLTARLGVVVRF